MASIDAGGGDDDGGGDGERERYFCHRCASDVSNGPGPSSMAEPTCPACSGGHFEAPSPLPPPAFLTLWPGPSPPQIAYPINASFNDFLDDVDDLLRDGEGDDLYDVELLISMAIGDNRSGAPPSSMAAVVSLPGINSEELLASDSAHCAGCKDSFELGSSAKQLPCKHLYHAGCILPWLDLRDSCPVCRYELPTDDDDYERRARRATPATGQDSPSATVAPGSGGGEGQETPTVMRSTMGGPMTTFRAMGMAR